MAGTSPAMTVKQRAGRMSRKHNPPSLSNGNGGLRCTNPPYVFVLHGRLKGFGKTGLSQDGVGGVSTWNADRTAKFRPRDRAVPNFMAAFALAHHGATCGTQELRNGRSNCGAI